MALLAISGYRLGISGFLGPNCRFEPTCSHYAEIAFRSHPPHYAFLLSIRRLLKCHPFGPFGFDPVPDHLQRGRLEKQLK